MVTLYEVLRPSNYLLFVVCRPSAKLLMMIFLCKQRSHRNSHASIAQYFLNSGGGPLWSTSTRLILFQRKHWQGLEHHQK